MASIRRFPSPLRRRFKEAEAGMAALDDMGFVIAGLTLTPSGTIILLREHTANDKLLGYVRRVYRDSAGLWVEMEKLVENNVRVRWLRAWDGAQPEPRFSRINIKRRTH